MAITVTMMIIGFGVIFAYRKVKVKEKQKEQEKEKQIILQSFGCGSCPSKGKCNKTDKCS